MSSANEITYGSVCSGIESASVAWKPLGFRGIWLSEIEPFPCALLKFRWPQIPNLGNMNILPELIRARKISAPDILIGGTPCQAFSVAGKGNSLDDSRGQLSLIYGDIINAIDEVRGVGNESVCVWENVPGVLSTKDNAFGWLLGLLAGEFSLDCYIEGRAKALEAQPGKNRQKWPKSGCVIGPKRTIAWRVLDAQYFGLAQRRKRVFVIASARTDFDPAKVLFECEGLRRDFAPGREAGETITGSIGEGSHWDNEANSHPTLNQSFNTGGIGLSNQELFSQRGGGLVSSAEPARTLLAQANDPHDESMSTYVVTHPAKVSNTLTARMYKGVNSDLNEGQSLVIQDTRNSYVHPAVATSAVRRLTPVECERLQGFPDNYTLLPFGIKQRIDTELKTYYECHLGRKLSIDEFREFIADGPRYKAIGNSKAVNCVRWLGKRIQAELR